MLRLTSWIAILALAGCSSKTPPSPGAEAPRATATTPAPATADDPTAAAPAPDPREAALSSIVLRLFEQQHLLHKKIDDGVSRIAFANYVKQLDVGKMFLLAGHRATLDRYVDQIDDELRSGSLDLAHAGQALFVARVAVVDKLVGELLAKPMDFTNEEYIELDFDKVEPVKTEDELRDRWRRRLELEVLERIGGMETRLEAEAKAKQLEAQKPKPGAKAKPGTAGKDAPPKAPGDPDAEAEEKALPIAQIPATPEAREAKARDDLAKSYAGRFARLRSPAPLEAAAELVNAVASALDPHTAYLPPADKANFDIRMSGSLQGIGASLRERDHYIEVMELIPGGAAIRQGQLAAGDLIIAVQAEGAEPVDTIDMRIDDVVKMIRGPKGTVVRLRVQKPTGAQQTIAITRDVVVVEDTYARAAVLRPKQGPAVGYIHLPSFYGGRDAGQRTAAGDVKRMLGELRAKKVAGVVLDIRANGGGLLGDAIEMTGGLIDRGPVVQVQDSRGRRETLSDEEPGIEYDGAVIVLVDRLSASASEILAGALQDYRRAVIVGTGPTHGKGTVQTLADLDRATNNTIELGSLKITIQQFFRVSGSSTQREGVTPDIVLPDPLAHIETGERELEHAIAWSKIDPAPHDTYPAKWKLDVLAQRSAARVGKQPLLAKVAATSALLKARRDDTRVPLAKPAWEARRKEQRAAIDAVSPAFLKQPPAFAVATVDGAADPEHARWRENLAKDPWVEESLYILADMVR